MAFTIPESRFVDVLHPEQELMLDNSTMGNGTESNMPSLVATRVAAGITTVFMLFGLVGNLLVIAAVARKKNLRTRGNAFIVSLSVVGLLYVGCVLIPGIDTLIFREWRTGDFMCVFHTYYSLAFSLLSLLHTMCIGLDRLVNVVLFTRAKRIASRRNIGIAVALCWLVTAGIMLCYHFFVVAGKMYYLEKALRCIAIYTASSWRASVVVYCFVYVLPSIVIVASYVAILSFVRKKRRLLYGNMGARAAPTRTIATSVTNGESVSVAAGCYNNTRDRVTFAPVALPEEKEQILQCSPLTPGSETNADSITADEGPTRKGLDGTKKNSSFEENQSTPLADIHRHSNCGAVYQSSVTINTLDTSPGHEPSCEVQREQDRATSNDPAARASTSADRNGEAAPQSGHRDKTRKTRKNIPLHARSSSLESNVGTVESTPSQCDLTQRRGSVWPAMSGRKRLSELAKTLGRGRDHVKPSRIRNDRDLNRMMLAVFLVVWFGYIPYPLVRYVDIPTLGIDVSSSVYMLVTVTSYVAGCVNPIIYGFMHRRFRAAFVEMLTLGKCKASNRVGAKGRDGSVSGTEGSTAVQRAE